ncbi:MAG: alpha/beta hydrolase [Solirubrobacteraceae bacterium MAG38_C4-C5]|nr:alpha/beta hydrolase [Candidatus Siliceabacter maunaloa]
MPGGAGPFPVTVVLHGGHWRTRYGKLVMRPLARDLADRGWAAWNLEYRRLGTGRRAGGGWPATFEDVAAGIDHLLALEDARLDLARVVGVGHSAGGQLALWAAARPGLPVGAPGAAPRVSLRAVVALAAVSDLERAGTVAHELLGGTPAAVPERFAQADPVRRVGLGVPAFLVHCADDATVPVKRSRAYAAAARAAGDDVELVEPATGGHRAPIDPGSEAWQAASRWLEGRRLG